MARPAGQPHTKLTNSTRSSKHNAKPRRDPGIETVHKTGCRSKNGGRCNCEPSFKAQVYSAAEGRRIRRSFPTYAAAKSWRADAQAALRRGTLRAARVETVKEAADALIAGMQAGSIRTRSGDRYEPSAIRSYEQALRSHVVP